MFGPGKNQRGPLASFRRFQPGDRPSASHANDISAAVEMLLRSQNGGGQDATVPTPDIVRVQNKSGSARKAGDVLVLTGLMAEVTSPTNHSLAFTAAQATSVATQRAVVLRSPLNPDYVGLGQLLGIVMASVDIVDATHRYATPKNASYSLESSTSGAYEILWKPTGGSATGVKDCIVTIGGGASQRAVADVFPTADGLFKTFTDAPHVPVLVLSFTRCSSGSVAEDPTCSPTWSPGTDFTALADPGWFAKGWERTGGSASAYMPPSFSGWPSGGSGEWVYEESIGAWIDSGCDWIIWI